MKDIIISVGGMSCPNCERVLHRALSPLDGVSHVQADYAKNQVRVSYEAPCQKEQLFAAIRDAGYSVQEHPASSHDGIYFLVILLGLYVIARQLGWTDIFQSIPVIQTARMSYAVLFGIGLLTSVHCVAMCGSINLTQSITGEASRPLRRSLLYNLGRLTSYSLIGGILGFIGEKAAVTLQVRGLIGLITGGLMVLMGINLMGGFGLLRRLTLRLPAPLVGRLAAFGRHGSYALGLVNGLMPCGPLQSMQLYAIASGSFIAGTLSMFFFCLGTIPLVLLLGTAAGVLRLRWKERMMQASAALLLVLGLFMVQNNLSLAGIQISAPAPADNGTVQISQVEDGVQYVTTYLHANGFEAIQVEEGIPVVWTMIVESGTLNGCNSEIVLPAFDQKVKLQEGENTISFTPQEAGSYPYTCWMGMLRSTITVTQQT